MKRLKFIKFFDKLEDKIRASLSRRPVVYALLGGIGIVAFWRGIWLTIDLISFMHGPISAIIGIVILLSIGLFASFFIGNEIILSGLKREKKLADKTEEELKGELISRAEIKDKLEKIEKDLEEIKKRFS